MEQQKAITLTEQLKNGDITWNEVFPQIYGDGIRDWTDHHIQYQTTVWHKAQGESITLKALMDNLLAYTKIILKLPPKTMDPITNIQIMVLMGILHSEQ